MVNDGNEKKRNATRSTRRKSERTSPRRSFTAAERGVYIRYLIRDLRSTLNEMNAFTCLLRAYLGASIRPFISSAPLPFSGWLPFLRGHHGIPITLSALPPPSWFVGLMTCNLSHARKFHGPQTDARSFLIFIDFRSYDNRLTHSDLFFISASRACNFIELSFFNFHVFLMKPGVNLIQMTLFSVERIIQLRNKKIFMKIINFTLALIQLPVIN